MLSFLDDEIDNELKEKLKEKTLDKLEEYRQQREKKDIEDPLQSKIIKNNKILIKIASPIIILPIKANMDAETPLWYFKLGNLTIKTPLVSKSLLYTLIIQFIERIF
jgi:hypothetical protein